MNMKELMKGKGDLEKYDELSKELILMYMYQDDNLEMKSEIKKPRDMTSLKVLSNFLKTLKRIKSSDTISELITIYLKYMVSHDRLGREELFKTLRSLFDKETIRMSISEKLTSNLKTK